MTSRDSPPFGRRAEYRIDERRRVIRFGVTIGISPGSGGFGAANIISSWSWSTRARASLNGRRASTRDRPWQGSRCRPAALRGQDRVVHSRAACPTRPAGTRASLEPAITDSSRSTCARSFSPKQADCCRTRAQPAGSGKLGLRSTTSNQYSRQGVHDVQAQIGQRASPRRISRYNGGVAGRQKT